MCETSKCLPAEWGDLQPTELERIVITEILQLYPLTISELIIRVASNPDDGATEDRVRIITRDLRRDGVVRYRNNDEVVEPTRAAIRMDELLTA